jgi:hypothetical protein
MSHFTYSEERAYDRYMEWREEQEEEDRYLEWEAEVDAQCECAWEREDEESHLKYLELPWKAPQIQCAFHRQLAEEHAEYAAQAHAAAAEWYREQEEKEARAAASLHIRVAAVEILERAKIGQHRFKVPIAYVKARLTVIERPGLPQDDRIQLIREIFTHLALPEVRPLLVEHQKFRDVVQAKINEFRGDPRAAELETDMDPLEAILEEIAAAAAAAATH